MRSSAVRSALLLFSLLGSLAAAPKLRLSTNSIGPISIATGSNGPILQMEAFNEGDGPLVPTYSSSVSWMRAEAVGTRSCEWAARPGSCLLINILLNTAGLPKGVAIGDLTVHDAAAIDSPQVVTVTVAIGGGLPDRIELWAARNRPPARATMSATTFLPLSYEPNNSWLSVPGTVTGTLKPGVTQGYTYTVTAQPAGGQPEGDYQGTIRSSNPTFPPDHKNIPVTLHVTTLPLADIAPARLRFRIAEGQSPAAQKGTVTITERGATPLTITGAATSGGSWLKAGPAGFTTEVTADAAGLVQGVYQGTVTVATNAANGPLVVPVDLTVVARSVPVPSYRGAVNIGTFLAEDGAAPGEILAVFGEQLAYGDPREAGAIPLPTSIGTTRVLVNGSPAPLFYVSYGQVNFQLPWETRLGEAVVQIERDGQLGSRIAVRVEERTPHLLRYGEYGVIQNFTRENDLPMPPSPGVDARRAQRGDIFVIYASGLGTASLAAPTGGLPPAGSLARMPSTVPVTVHFGDVTAVPDFAGLAPTLVGIHQINVTVPANAPRGDRVQLWIDLGGTRISNTVLVAIE